MRKGYINKLAFRLQNYCMDLGGVDVDFTFYAEKSLIIHESKASKLLYKLAQDAMRRSQFSMIKKRSPIQY